MSLDVSPDGRTIVFDLLGDLYVLPIGGGHARRITHGLAIDRQPRFSPDGRRIVFLSDRTGEDAVWTCDANGGNQHAIITAKQRYTIVYSFSDPVWLPRVNNGDTILVTEKYLWNHRDSYDLAVFDTRGRRLRTPLLGHAPVLNNWPPYTSTPALGPTDERGRRLIYATELTAAGDNLNFTFQIVRIDPLTGVRTILTDESGSAVSPLPSPNGRFLIYATNHATPNGLTTGLKVLDLQTMAKQWLVSDVEPSQHTSGVMVYEGHALLPHIAFTPDGQYLIVAYHGKIWRVSVPSGNAIEIPFDADVEQELGPLLRFRHRIDDSIVTARVIRDVRTSPNGEWLAFTALDRIWLLRRGDTKPHQVTTNELAPGAIATEHTPAWSPDGKYLAFCTWTEHGGHIWRVPTKLATKGSVSTRNVEQLTTRSDYYDKLVYAPDGSELLFIHAKWQAALRSRDLSVPRDLPSAMPELAAMPSEGGSMHTLMGLDAGVLRGQNPGYGWPHFSQRDPRSVFLFSGSTLWSVARDGTEHHAVATLGGFAAIGVRDVLLSPSGNRAVASRYGWEEATLAIVAVPRGREPVKLPLPEEPKQDPSLNPVGGDCPWWAEDGTLTYSLGHSYFRDAHGFDIVVRVPADRPQGTVLLSNARVLTMSTAGVLEHGDVLIRDDRIEAVGPHGMLDIPESVTRFDLTGKTLLPGYVLTHEHVFEPFGVHVPRLWSYLAALAFGITTIHDPQGSSLDRFSYADVLETGALLGPRHFSTGKAIEVWPLDSLQEAENLVKRYSRFYGTWTLKERGAGNRLVRQWLAIAAHKERLTAVAHWHEDIESHVLDGYSGLEHASFIPLYDDAIQLIANGGSVYTPTTMVASLAGPRFSAMAYFAANYPVASDSDARLRRFVRWSGSQFLLNGQHAPSDHIDLDESTFVHEARSAAKLAAAGGHVGIGSDIGPFWALPDHWELWALAMGGMTSQQLLQSATRTGAEALGIDQDLGTIAPGKLADLQILDRNPLEDIHNTLSVSRVMRNGRLYDTMTLDEIWPERRPLLKSPDDSLWWETEWPTTPGH